MGAVPEPTLYLFDGYNLLHAGGHEDVRALDDELASFVAMKGARGVVVFDGVGEEFDAGPLSVRYAPDADTLLERLAAEHRHSERVCLVSSDVAIRGAPPARRCARCRRARSCTSSRARPRTSRIRRHACATGSIRRRGRSSSASAAGSSDGWASASPAVRLSASVDERVGAGAYPNTCSNHRGKFAKGL